MDQSIFKAVGALGVVALVVLLSAGPDFAVAAIAVAVIVVIATAGFWYSGRVLGVKKDIDR